MWIQVRSMDGSKSCKIDGLSRLTKIKDLREKIENEFNCPPDCQRLFYRGKQLENNHSLFDYDVQLNDIIQIIITKSPIVNNTDSQESSENKSSDGEETNKENFCKGNSTSDSTKPHTYTDCLLHSKYYEVGDKLDLLDAEVGCWMEGKLMKITRQKKSDITSSSANHADVLKENASQCLANNNDASAEESLVYHVVLEGECEEKHEVQKKSIRLRAKKKIEPQDLEIGTRVMVNYNVEEPQKVGYYYDMLITDVKNVNGRLNVCGTLFIGSELSQLENIKLTQLDKIWKIEPEIRVEDREKSFRDNFPTEKRPVKPSCDDCNDDPKSKCKKCSCVKCGGKDSPNKQILCDECDGPYHLWCLEPPLTAVPDTDYWFCPNCKNDETEIVRAGESLKDNKKKAKMPSASAKCQRDWGRGMATAGRTKKCTIVPENHFGPIPSVEVGSCWKFRMQVGEAGVHRPQVAGIHGREKEGAYSIVLSGGYEDDVDDGDEFTYTGSGGRDLSGNKRTAEQSCDQELTRMNKALALNCHAPFNKKEGAEATDWKKGKPVRVVRNYKGHKHSKFCPNEGNRYDGIYKVVKYWPESGKSGFIVWRYMFRRDDPIPAPWTKEGKARIAKLGLTIEYPPGYEEKEDKVPKEKSTKRSRDASSPKSSSASKKVKVEDYKLEDELREQIKTDSENQKLWEESLSFCNEGRKKFLEKVEELFTCICCQDLVYNPITIECQHNVCKACLKRSFKSEVYSCPHCRFDLGKSYAMKINENLLQVLLKLFPGYESGRSE